MSLGNAFMSDVGETKFNPHLWSQKYIFKNSDQLLDASLPLTILL
jgi:hypothetical protein